MRHFNPLLVLLLLAVIALAACTPGEPTPGAPAPTTAVTPEAPTSEQPTPTTEPPPTDTPEPAEPTATAEAETPEPTATTEPAEPTTFCPEIARPALILFLPSDQLLLFDPASGATCPLPVPGRYAGMVELTPGAFFSPAPSATAGGDALVIQRYLPDGTVEDLPYTLLEGAGAASYTGFTVSGDARLIAWGSIGPSEDGGMSATSLSIASLETGEVTATVTPEPGVESRGLMPIRFDPETDTLYYALQPYGVGGSWIAFVGRYDNLYAMPADGSGEPELIFDCADKGLFLCLGDFFVTGGAVTGLAYVDQEAGTLFVENGAGEVLNTLQGTEDYIGYPTWGPVGELVYYTATLAEMTDGPPAAELGNLQRVAPPTAPAETIVSDPALALPIEFLDDTRVVVNWVTEAETGLWGLALAGVEGSVELLDVPSGASVAGIVR